MANSDLIKRINRTTSLQTMGVVFIANLVLGLIYYKTLYVRQASIDTSKLDAMNLNSGNHVCFQNAEDVYNSLGYPQECSANCLCFKF
jgi:hypothetical protein